MRTRSGLAAMVCAVVFGAVGVTGALAGEVKGPPTAGVPSVNNDTAAPFHANSICAFSGLNDFRNGPTVNRTQTPANQGAPGTPGTACQGGKQFRKGYRLKEPSGDGKLVMHPATDGTNGGGSSQRASPFFRQQPQSRQFAQQAAIRHRESAAVKFHIKPLVGLCYSRRWKSVSWSRSTGWWQVRQRPAQQRRTGCRSSTACGSVRPAAGLLGAAVPG